LKASLMHPRPMSALSSVFSVTSTRNLSKLNNTSFSYSKHSASAFCARNTSCLAHARSITSFTSELVGLCVDWWNFRYLQEMRNIELTLPRN
jgi:hypothetical protein